MSKVEESLRELVREELKGQKPTPLPDKRQIVWLFLCVANTALLLWLLPETLFKNERIENLSKVVVWLGSSIFISSFVWFREKLLVLTLNGLFKIILVVALPVLTLIYISQLNIFAIHPDIEPQDAEVIVRGQTLTEEDREDIALSLDTHWITVQPADWHPQNNPNQYPKPRKFKLTRLDVLRAWWGSDQPRWYLVYDVYVQPQGAVDEVIVEPLKGEFDREFMMRPDPPLSPTDTNLPILGAPSAQGKDLVYEWHGIANAQLPLRLPHGKYAIFSRKNSCEGKREEVEVPVLNDKTTVLQEPCPSNQ